MPSTKQYKASTRPEIVLPPNTSTLSSSQVKVVIPEHSLLVSSYQLTAGSSQDASDFYDSGIVTSKPDTLSGLPYNADISVTLAYTNSGVTKKIRYFYKGASPSLIAPVGGRRVPFGVVPIEGTPVDPHSTYTVKVVGAVSGTTYYIRNGLTKPAHYWRPPEDLSEPVIISLKWDVSGVTLHSQVTVMPFPEVEGVKVPVMLARPNPVGVKDILEYPTKINLFRDGKESRFTTSNSPILSSQFSLSAVSGQQEGILRYIREHGRKMAWTPLMAHAVCGKLEGAKVVVSKDLVMTSNWAYSVTDYCFVYSTRTGQAFIEKVVGLTKGAIIFDSANPLIDMQGSVEACPCIPANPDFTSMAGAGSEGMSVGVSTSKRAVRAPSMVAESLAANVQGYKVLPILSPFSSRKFSQLLESTRGSHKPEYFPIAKGAVDLTSYNYSWGTTEEQGQLVKLFVDLKGAQNSVLLCDYSASFKFLGLTTDRLRLSVAHPDDTESTTLTSYRYVAVFNGSSVVSVHKVASITKHQDLVQLTLSTAISAEGAKLLQRCSDALREATLVRLSTSVLTMNSLGYGKGSAQLDFTEVLE